MADEKSHLLLSLLVKHLDHKEVIKQSVLHMHIVNVTIQLSQYVQQQASVSIIGAITDLIKHLRKCIQNSSESSSPRDESDSCYIDLQCALENCISHLSCKVGDVGPILDMMDVVLENIPTSTAVAKETLSALCSIVKVGCVQKRFLGRIMHPFLGN